MRRLNYQEAKDIQMGSSILSTGGGGDIQLGMDALEIAYKNQKDIFIMDLDELDPEEYYASVGLIGAVSDDAPIIEELDLLKHSIEVIEEHIGMPLRGIIPPEFGGITGEILAVGAMMGKPIIDCDCVGRAVPSMIQDTFNIVNRGAKAPISVVSMDGSFIVIDEDVDPDELEERLRKIAIASGNIAAFAVNVTQGKHIKTSTINNALSMCEKVGRARREAIDSDKNPIDSIINMTDGYELFKGQINKKSYWETKDGFTIGEIFIDGTNDFSDQNFKIWMQNENLISWKNDKVYVSCPDLICILDANSLIPISNPNWNQDQVVIVLGFKSPLLWRTEKGIDLFGPRVFGYKFNFIPIEKYFK